MKHNVSKQALKDFRELVERLRDNSDRFRNDGDPNITMPEGRVVSGNSGPVINGPMQSPPELNAIQGIDQQSVFRKVNGGGTLQEKLNRLPDAPPLEDNKNSLATTKDQAAQNVVAESKHSAAPQASSSSVQDRIKAWEQRAKTQDQTLKRH